MRGENRSTRGKTGVPGEKPEYPGKNLSESSAKAKPGHIRCKTGNLTTDPTLVKLLFVSELVVERVKLSFHKHNDCNGLINKENVLPSVRRFQLLAFFSFVIRQ